MPRKRIERPRPPCEICGALIPRKRGMPAKTCGAECAAEHNRRRERERYHQIKDTPEWRATRADYLQRLKARLAADPALAEQLRERHRAALQRYRVALEKDPERLEAYRAKQRAWWGNATPEQRERNRARSLEWYRSLTPEERQIYIYDRRRERAQQWLEMASAAANEP